MKGCKRIDSDSKAKRANPPDIYVCPNCGERLSGPARFYTCPDVFFGVRHAVEVRRPAVGAAA
jgi:hypothetical protein